MMKAEILAQRNAAEAERQRMFAHHECFSASVCEPDHISRAYVCISSTERPFTRNDEQLNLSRSRAGGEAKFENVRAHELSIAF